MDSDVDNKDKGMMKRKKSGEQTLDDNIERALLMTMEGHGLGGRGGDLVAEGARHSGLGGVWEEGFVFGSLKIGRN